MGPPRPSNTTTQERPNNRFKGPFLMLIAAVGLFDASLGVVSGGPWWVVALGLLVFVAAIALWRFVRQGRNPWWLRAPLDPKSSDLTTTEPPR